MGARSKKKSVLIIGIGSELRGDDAAGLHVVRDLLSGELPSCAAAVEMTGDGASLMESWKNWPHVILVDAITAGLPSGSVIRMDVRKEFAPANLFATSSHSFGVAQAIAISLALGELPPNVTLFGIQAGTFRVGSPISAEVQKSVGDTVAAIRRELEVLRASLHRHRAASPTGLPVQSE